MRANVSAHSSEVEHQGNLAAKSKTRDLEALNSGLNDFYAPQCSASPLNPEAIKASQEPQESDMNRRLERKCKCSQEDQDPDLQAQDEPVERLGSIVVTGAVQRPAILTRGKDPSSIG
ncbi:hypothetical protein MMC07_008791 [Pseudocyphellaria aurata]|nr:hypothetical protein [Pseudocyphellaria aurata]